MQRSGWIMGCVGGVAAVGMALALAGCDSPLDAPTNVGYCWRAVVGADGKPQFTPVSVGDRNLETCGAHLEAVSLREKKPTLTGAFQGQYIFITPLMIQSSMRLKGVRYRLFDAVVRAKIDRRLTWMLEDEGHASKFAPSASAPAPGRDDETYVRHQPVTKSCSGSCSPVEP